MHNACKDKKKIINAIGKCLSVISICFIIYAVWKMGLDYSFVNNKLIFFCIMVACVGLKLASLWFSSTAWATWLKFFSKTPFEMKRARQVFIKANIGRYIPGNVMHFVQRNLFATNMGISQVQLAISTIFEVASYVVSALLLSLITARKSIWTVVKSYFEDRLYIILVIMICLVVAALVSLLAFRRKISDVLAGYDRKSFLVTLLSVMLIQLITLTLLGIAMVLLVSYATGEFNWGITGTVISTYIVAWVLGFVVPGASGGMGIREMALLLLLGPVLGESLVLSLALVHRLITVIGDFLGYLIAVYCEKVGKEANNA